LASKCGANTRGGQPCKGLVRPGNDYCPAHDPSRREARRRAASKAGKSKPGCRELADIKERLSSLAEDVLRGNVDKGDAAVCSQLYNVLLRAIGMELKVKELEEMEAKLGEMEKALKRQGEGAAYGSAG